MEPKRPGSLQDLFNETARLRLESTGLTGQALADALELEWKLIRAAELDDLRHGYRAAMLQFKADSMRYKEAERKRK